MIFIRLNLIDSVSIILSKKRINNLLKFCIERINIVFIFLVVLYVVLHNVLCETTAFVVAHILRLCMAVNIFRIYFYSHVGGPVSSIWVCGMVTTLGCMHPLSDWCLFQHSQLVCKSECELWCQERLKYLPYAVCVCIYNFFWLGGGLWMGEKKGHHLLGGIMISH